MELRLRIDDNMKDASGKKKRVLMATLTTDIKGMPPINTVGEIPKGDQLGLICDEIITSMLALAQTEKKKLKGKPVKIKK